MWSKVVIAVGAMAMFGTNLIWWIWNDKTTKCVCSKNSRRQRSRRQSSKTNSRHHQKQRRGVATTSQYTPSIRVLELLREQRRRQALITVNRMKGRRSTMSRPRP